MEFWIIGTLVFLYILFRILVPFKLPIEQTWLFGPKIKRDFTSCSIAWWGWGKYVRYSVTASKAEEIRIYFYIFNPRNIRVLIFRSYDGFSGVYVQYRNSLSRHYKEYPRIILWLRRAAIRLLKKKYPRGTFTVVASDRNADLREKYKIA